MNLTVSRSYNDWLVLLKDLANGVLTITPNSGEHASLLSLSRAWPTCACGQLCQTLPKVGGNNLSIKDAPADTQLQDLGRTFHYAVLGVEWPHALQTFKKIELRSAFLLKEQALAEQYKKDAANL